MRDGDERWKTSFGTSQSQVETTMTNGADENLLDVTQERAMDELKDGGGLE